MLVLVTCSTTAAPTLLNDPSAMHAGFRPPRPTPTAKVATYGCDPETYAGFYMQEGDPGKTHDNCTRSLRGPADLIPPLPPCPSEVTPSQTRGNAIEVNNHLVIKGCPLGRVGIEELGPLANS